eukprot:5069353-Alexandrium_andersonii.AAC.1
MYDPLRGTWARPGTSPPRAHARAPQPLLERPRRAGARCGTARARGHACAAEVSAITSPPGDVRIRTSRRR